MVTRNKKIIQETMAYLKSFFVVHFSEEAPKPFQAPAVIDYGHGQTADDRPGDGRPDRHRQQPEGFNPRPTELRDSPAGFNPRPGDHPPAGFNPRPADHRGKKYIIYMCMCTENPQLYT